MQRFCRNIDYGDIIFALFCFSTFESKNLLKKSSVACSPSCAGRNWKTCHVCPKKDTWKGCYCEVEDDDWTFVDNIHVKASYQNPKLPWDLQDDVASIKCYSDRRDGKNCRFEIWTYKKANYQNLSTHNTLDIKYTGDYRPHYEKINLSGKEISSLKIQFLD